MHGNLRVKLFHDTILMGIRDTTLSECLQLDSDLINFGEGQKVGYTKRSCQRPASTAKQY